MKESDGKIPFCTNSRRWLYLLFGKCKCEREGWGQSSRCDYVEYRTPTVYYKRTAKMLKQARYEKELANFEATYEGE